MKLTKDIIKGTCIGTAMTVVLGLAVPTYADVYKKQLDAVFSDIKVVIDGYQITPKDSNGKVVEPFIVDGTTYLPVRAVSEALGQTVTWDGNTQTVYIGEVKKGVVGFDTLKPFKINASNVISFYTDLGSKGWKVRGNVLPTPSNAIGSKTWVFGNSAYGEYNLNGDYVKLTAKAAVSDETGISQGAKIEILGDGKILYSCSLKVGDMEQDIDISLIGVKTLKIVFAGTSYAYEHSYPIIYDAKFYPIS